MDRTRETERRRQKKKKRERIYFDGDHEVIQYELDQSKKSSHVDQQNNDQSLDCVGDN